MTDGEEQACSAVEDVAAAAADIICSLRGADLAGWTPPWKAATKEEEELVAWPAVARGKRSRSRRRSPSGSGSAAKGRWARGSPASPLDYSGGSGASTSGGEDGAFCSPPAPAVPNRRATAVVTPTPPPQSTKVVGGSSARSAGRRPPPTTILPVPPPRPAGQRSRKKMRLPEVQQLVRSLTVENVGLREEMESLRRACTALSTENGQLETMVQHSSGKRKGVGRSEEERPRKTKLEQRAAARQDDRNGFVLPDLNIPAEDDVTVDDGSAAARS